MLLIFDLKMINNNLILKQKQIKYLIFKMLLIILWIMVINLFFVKVIMIMKTKRLMRMVLPLKLRNQVGKWMILKKVHE